MLALFLLLAFVGAGFLFFKKWVVQKPFGIILFVSDGLVPSNLASARLYAGGSSYRLSMEALSNVALLRNASSNFAVPDCAAAATAMATGQSTKNGVFARSGKGEPQEALETLFLLAGRAGRKCGLVTSGSVIDPSVAPFYANGNEQETLDSIASQLVAFKQLDLVMGGGRSAFIGESKGGIRKDERDLLLELRKDGAKEIRSRDELETLSSWGLPRVFGLFAEATMPFRDQRPQSDAVPSLSQMTRRAIELLQGNQAGYVLVIESGLVREAARFNHGERTLAELNELDEAVKTARAYAGDNAMILVAGSTVTGGLQLNGNFFRQHQGIAVLGTNPFGMPSLTWSTGPNGANENGVGSTTEPASFFTPKAEMVVSDVLAFGEGQGTEKLKGIQNSTFIFDLLRSQF